MTLYVESDIRCNFSGDLVLDQKGDLSLANPLDTYKSVANFILRTDFGEYAPNPVIGSNLGSYIGASNTRETHEHMENSITRSLVDNVFGNTDVSVDVVPIDINDAVCFVHLAGSFLISGAIVTVNQDTMSYMFPYIDGNPSPLTV